MKKQKTNAVRKSAINVSRLTSKGQATIPVEIRKKLSLRSGDKVIFVVEGKRVSLRKATPLDAGFLALSAEAFQDWNSPEDEEAFRGL